MPRSEVAFADGNHGLVVNSSDCSHAGDGHWISSCDADSSECSPCSSESETECDQTDTTGVASVDFSPLDLNPAIFEQPCLPLCVSGGTSYFYRLVHADSRSVRSYVGKDFSAHSKHEVTFYCRLRTMKELQKTWTAFAKHTLDCLGVLNLECLKTGDQTPQKRPLLVLLDLTTNFDKCRLMDLKIGSSTGAACWKGKGRMDAWGLRRIDQRTNSTIEGFRLEGMESKPVALESYVQVVEKYAKNNQGFLTNQQVSKYTLQRLRGREVLDFFFDMSCHGAVSEKISHCVLWKCLERMDSLLKAVLSIPIPQQWIGSSLGVCLEVGQASSDHNVDVKGFDWGRSEIITAEEYARLSPERKRERIKFWRQYVQALCHFHWHLIRVAIHRCCVKSFAAFVFELRIEKVNMLKAAMWGDRSVSTKRVGYLEMSGIAPNPTAELCLPLVAQASSGHPPGTLHLQLTLGDACIVGSNASRLITLTLKGTSKLPEAEPNKDQVATLRVNGFELPEDARRHVQAVYREKPEPTPLARAYSRHSAPAVKVDGKYKWQDSMQFIGLGANRSQENQDRLASFLSPTNVSERRCASRRIELDLSAEGFFQKFPAALGRGLDVEVGDDYVCSLFAPWASVVGTCPLEWA